MLISSNGEKNLYLGLTLLQKWFNSLVKPDDMYLQ